MIVGLSTPTTLHLGPRVTRSPTAYTPEGLTRRRSVQSTTTTGYARWETGASRLNWDENSQSRPNPKYALTVARIFDPLHGEWWVSW